MTRRFDLLTQAAVRAMGHRVQVFRTRIGPVDAEGNLVHNLVARDVRMEVIDGICNRVSPVTERLDATTRGGFRG